MNTESTTGSGCQKQDWPNHKLDCQAQNYILEVKLCPEDIVDPAVTRTLSCPAPATFEELHEVLQVAFGWASTHTFDFLIKDPNAAPPREMTFEDYMAKLQASFGQGPAQDPGPRQNFLRIKQYEEEPMGSGVAVDLMHAGLRVHPETPEIVASKIKLGKVLEQYKGSPIQYQYDFGDHWDHEITVIGRAAATDVFICTSGEGHGVAEDVGGSRAWQDLKAAYRTQRPSKDQKEKMNWFENQASNSDSYGLGNGRDRIFDREGINFRLARM